MGRKKLKKLLDLFKKLDYSITTMNDEHYNEEDAATQRLLESVCAGVALPTEAEEREVAALQGQTGGQLEAKQWTAKGY
tara:strand:- start:230 stop:466 length:237 start_codon:yes stop_codon:yes gene_type:complete